LRRGSVGGRRKAEKSPATFAATREAVKRKPRGSQEDARRKPGIGAFREPGRRSMGSEAGSAPYGGSGRARCLRENACLLPRLGPRPKR
jgi:hypothetical protein